jgi:CheY-like chemotaxis protein
MASTTVAIINTSDDLVEMLKVALENAGFVVVVSHVSEIRSMQFDVKAFLELHDPRVILYDVGVPLDRNWRFLEHLRSSPGFGGRHFVLTSVNVRALHEIVKTDERVYEVVGRNSEIAEIVRAVKEASRARPTR